MLHSFLFIFFRITTNDIVVQIMFSIITMALLLVMVFMKDKVRLVTMLFREGTKATFDMQMIFSVPVVVGVQNANCVFKLINWEGDVHFGNRCQCSK